MNDKYIQEEQKAVKTTRDQLITLKQSLTATQSAAKVALYLAHGNVDRNKLNQWRVDQRSTEAKQLSNQAVRAVNLATQTVAAANNSLTESKNAISNVATAASNMQLAANAITTLASEVAGVLAVASSVNYDSDIYQSVDRSNKLAQQAARCAEKVSLSSLDSTVKASQSAAEDVLKDAQSTLNTLTDFQTSTGENFGNEAEKVVEAIGDTTTAIQSQNSALENYNITGERDKAVESAVLRLNEVSNHDLLMIDPALSKKNPDQSQRPGFKINMRFRRFMDESVISEYRLLVVPRDEAPAFDLTTAKSIQNHGTGGLRYICIQPEPLSSSGSTGCLTNGFKPPQECDGPGIADCEQIVNHSNSDTVIQGIHLSHYAVNLQYKSPSNENGKHTDKIDWYFDGKLVQDFSGRPIVHGKSYVAFLYVVYDMAHQSRTNNTNGYLSTASPWLTPRFRLKKAPMGRSEIKVLSPHNARKLAVQFKAPESNKNEFNPVEYRAVFVFDQNLELKKDNSAAEQEERKRKQREEREAAKEALGELLKQFSKVNDKENGTEEWKVDRSNFKRLRDDYIESSCLIRGLLLREDFDELVEPKTSQNVIVCCRKMLSDRQSSFGIIVNPFPIGLTCEDIIKRIVKANEFYEPYSLLSSWTGSNEDKSNFETLVKSKPRYLNLLTSGTKDSADQIKKEINDLLAPIRSRMVEGEGKKWDAVVEAGLLLFLLSHLETDIDGNASIEAMNKIASLNLEILDMEGQKKNRLSAIFNYLSKSRSEAKNEIENKFNQRQQETSVKRYVNRYNFPFDQEVMDMLAPNNYLVARAGSEGKEDDPQGSSGSRESNASSFETDLNKSLQAVCSAVRESKPVKGALKHFGEASDKEKKFKNWVMRNYGTRKSFLTNTVGTIHLWRCYLLLVNYQLEKWAGTGGDPKFEDGPTTFTAKPERNEHPVNNYGNPLVVNDLTESLRVQLANCIFDNILSGLVNNTCKSTKIKDCEKTWNHTFHSLIPVSYRVIIISAFKGTEAERPKYIESHSEYSKETVMLYPQPQPENN